MLSKQTKAAVRIMELEVEKEARWPLEKIEFGGGSATGKLKAFAFLGKYIFLLRP